MLLCPAFSGACAQFVESQHHIDLAVFFLPQFLRQCTLFPLVGVACHDIPDLINGKSDVTEVVGIGEVTVQRQTPLCESRR